MKKGFGRGGHLLYVVSTLMMFGVIYFVLQHYNIIRENPIDKINSVGLRIKTTIQQIEQEKEKTIGIEKEIVTLIKTIDGDTANFSTSYGNKNVRWSGVNTPETKHPSKGVEPYGVEASDFTKDKLETATTIEIEWDLTQKWSYDRPIGIVFVDGENLNLLLVREGLADLVYLKDTMPYASEYRQALDQAKSEKKGMWK